MSSEFPGRSRGKWSETTLWLLLSKSQKPEDQAILNLLQRSLPRIETILGSAGTSPHAFTLHDADHSFRVAQRIAEVIPANVLPKLASYELALLLLAAYVHDIGMTPEEQKVTSHYDYLLTGERGSSTGSTSCLTDDDIKKFQQWLDDNERGLSPPTVKGKLTAEDLHTAAELITYYSRYRHVDWTEEWLRKTFAGEKLGTYAGWLDDLIVLSRSHHLGKSDLLGSAFNPRLIGSPAVVVHLRYLACALRVADILDFDPERTPEVILQHREIPIESLIHWYKDHAIAMRKDGNALALAARPTNAKLHKAIEAMCDDIDDELQTCRSIADETHFENCPNVDLKLPHRWDLQHAIRRDLQPREGTYEYIDGAFRPNTRKLLQLFAGTQLYREPLAAVRELAQNAFDAIRERIAYQRLATSNPLDNDVDASIRKLHQVELEVETRADGTWLICQDNGVGMTRSIIIHHLLVSGQSRRHDILELARRCREAGITFDRTGQFGIGVLSYFMIADRVVISTRRSPEPGDADESGWRFETEGIGSFGELRRDTKVPAGSRVELRLKEDVAADPIEWFGGLRHYLNDNVRYAPCELRLNAALPGSEPLIIPSDWTHTSDEFRGSLSPELYKVNTHETPEIPSELLPEVDRRQREEEQEHIAEVRSELENSLRWVVSSGELPGGLGRYRLHLPYFSLDGGVSLAFLRVTRRNGQLTLGNIKGGLGILPRRSVHVSWKGMLIRLRDYEFVSSFEGGYKRQDVRPIVEIDFSSNQAGELSVNRSDFSVKDDGKRAGRWLGQLAAKITQDFALKHADSDFATINRRLSGAGNLSIAEPKWIVVQKPGDKVWQHISFPATTSLAWIYREVPEQVLWKNKQVQVLCGLRPIGERHHYEGPAFVSHSEPDRIVSIDDFWEKIVWPLWPQNPFNQPKETWRMKCQFPPEWPNLCGVHFDHYGGPQTPAVLWNANHVVVQSADKDSWDWARQNATKNADPLTFKADLLSDRKKAAAWLLLSMLRIEREIWLGLLERDLKFATALWELLFKHDRNTIPTSLCLWFQEAVDSKLYEVSLTGGAVQYRTGELIERQMPTPSGEWHLETSQKSRRG